MAKQSKAEDASNAITSLELALFCRQVGTMLLAGVDVLRALRVAGEQTESRRLESVAQRIARDNPGLMRDGSFYADVALERAATFDPRLSALVQLTLASPRLKGTFHDGEFDTWPGNLIFGMTGLLGHGWRVEASFQEDIPASSPAADFTVVLGVRRRW